MIQLIMTLVAVLNESVSGSCDLFATAAGYSASKLKAVVFDWMNNGRIAVNDRPRGAGSSLHRHHRVHFTDQEREMVERFRQSEHQSGHVLTVASIQSMLSREARSLSDTSIRFNLKRMNWSNRRIEEVPTQRDGGAFLERMRTKFCEVMRTARQQEMNGDRVLVFLDESYIWNSHAPQYSWGPRGEQNEVTRDRRKYRYVILHAITKDGLVTKMHNSTHIDDLTVQLPTAACIYKIETSAQSKAEDENDKESYHGNVDSNLFRKWVENRLLPALRAMYGVKKQFILIMDNASYHCTRQGDPPSKLKRDGLLAALQSVNVASITRALGHPLKLNRVDRERVQITADEHGSLNVNISDGAAETKTLIVGHNKLRVADMRTALLACVAQDRDYRPSVLDELLKPVGHSIIFTPPYTPRFQPIERVWGMAKQTARSLFQNGNTPIETLHHIHSVLYEHQYANKSGVQDWSEGINKHHCRSLINQALRSMNAFCRHHAPHLDSIPLHAQEASEWENEDWDDEELVDDDDEDNENDDSDDETMNESPAKR